VSDRSPRARTWYQDEYAATGYELALLGQTLAEMGETFGVDERTINRWMTKPKFRRAVNAGRAAADGKMAVALYKRGLGYSHPAVKIFPPKSEGGEPVTVDYIQHYPPDTAAASLWLRNRQPSKWREKTEMAVTGQLTLEHLILTAATERQAEQPAIEGEIIKPDDEG
jgi:hypothetical protein